MLKVGYLHEQPSLQSHLLEMKTSLPCPYLDDQTGNYSSAVAYLPF